VEIFSLLWGFGVVGFREGMRGGFWSKSTAHWCESWGHMALDGRVLMGFGRRRLWWWEVEVVDNDGVVVDRRESKKWRNRIWWERGGVFGTARLKGDQSRESELETFSHCSLLFWFKCLICYSFKALNCLFEEDEGFI
jgi:hypothetical protein